MYLVIVRIKRIISAALVAVAMLSAASCSKHKTVLIVGGWHDGSIGVLAQTPGLINVLSEQMPDSRIIVWNKTYSEEADSSLLSHYPKLEIVNGEVDEKGNVHSREVLRAFRKADLLIHGSALQLTGEKNILAWRNYTDKPYGIYAATFSNIEGSTKEIIEGASFIFARESSSLAVLRDAGIPESKIELVPDSTFGFNLRDDAKAESFMAQNGLSDKGFICVIPRLRITPYGDFTKEHLRQINELNDSCKGPDHDKLVEAVTDWVRTTGNKVVLCPEMSYEVDIMDELVIDRLPDDVKPFVVKHRYWFPDEAASLYSHAICVISFDSHSPILSLCSGTPAFYLSQSQDCRKGNMFNDLGYDDWKMSIDSTSGEKIFTRLMSTYNNPAAAESYLAGGLNEARKRLEAGIRKIKNYLS